MIESITTHHREMRARQFASQILDAIRQHIPDDGGAFRQIHDELYRSAYESNAMIVNLPEEYDRLTEAVARRRMLESFMQPIIMETEKLDAPQK